jgi:hypothetical protein
MASRDQAANLINNLWSYFRTTDPPEKSVDVWINDILSIDLNSAGDFISRKIKSLDKWPTNFPGTVKALYFQWRRDQPREQSAKGCNLCLDGIIHAKDEFGYCYAFGCGHCNTGPGAYPTATRYSLEEQGYFLDWQHDFDGPVDRETRENIKGLARAPEVERMRREQSDPMGIPF